MKFSQDFFFDLGYFFDSIEPSVSWSKCWGMIQAIKKVWNLEMEKRKLRNILAIRLSQVYNTGACVYLYYGIEPPKNQDQLEAFEELTSILRKAIKTSGGSLSHHHGIGKKNSKYYNNAVSEAGVELFKAVKAKLDPNNIFDAGNLIEEEINAKL